MIFYHRHFNSQYSAKAIYGIILVQALLINFEHNQDTNPINLALKTFIGALVIVFAEIYSEFLGGTISGGKLTDLEKIEIGRDALSVSAVSINPTLLFLISATGLITTQNAFLIAYILGLLELAIFGFIAARTAGKKVFKSIRTAIITTLVGFFIIAIKCFIH